MFTTITTVYNHNVYVNVYVYVYVNIGEKGAAVLGLTFHKQKMVVEDKKWL